MVVCIAHASHSKGEFGNYKWLFTMNTGWGNCHRTEVEDVRVRETFIFEQRVQNFGRQKGRCRIFDSCQLWWWLFFAAEIQRAQVHCKLCQPMAWPTSWNTKALADGWRFCSNRMSQVEPHLKRYHTHPQPARLDQSLEQAPPYPWYLLTLLWSHGFELQTRGRKGKSQVNMFKLFQSSTTILFNFENMLISYCPSVQEVLEQFWHQLQKVAVLLTHT
jgi:hypothetical protein